MLTLTLPKTEVFDETNSKFITLPERTIHMEHSLYSVSKWEMKWHIPFTTVDKTAEQTDDYLMQMICDDGVDDSVLLQMDADVKSKIMAYMDDPMTATVINESGPKKKPNPFAKEKPITNEEIYYYMTELNIPFECEHWNYNRLLTLIRVCSIKKNPDKKKMSKSDIMKNNKALNAARRKSMGTKG